MWYHTHTHAHTHTHTHAHAHMHTLSEQKQFQETRHAPAEGQHMANLKRFIICY